MAWRVGLGDTPLNNVLRLALYSVFRSIRGTVLAVGRCVPAPTVSVVHCS